jgi:hypothetical protein
MAGILHKSYKKRFQDLIIKNGLELSDFEFINSALTTYKIKYLKENNYSFQCDNKPSTSVNFFEFNGGSNSSQAATTTWEKMYEYYDSWLKLIKQEQAIVLYEDLKKHIDFSSTINSISPTFSKIYNQALKSENDFLDEICGMGYRKAFEFLLKEYLIYLGNLTSKEANDITQLRLCVDKLNENYIIQKLAKYTAYLGNDFSHYYRKWINQEIADLKEMINLLVDWIDTTESHKQKLLEIEAKAQLKIDGFENKSSN